MKYASRLALCLTLALAASFAVTGCSTLTKIEHALTGQPAILSVEIVGSTVDSIMQAAAKARVAGDITASQWATIAALHDKYQPIYQAEVANLVKANGAAASASPSAALTAIMSQIVATAEAFKKPAATLPATAAPAK